MSNIIFIVFQAGVALYLLYSAIRGTSKIFNSPYVKDGKEALYKKIGRIGFVVIALLLLTTATLNILVNQQVSTVNDYIAEHQLEIAGITDEEIAGKTEEEIDALLSERSNEITQEQMLERLNPENAALYQTALNYYQISQILTYAVLTLLLALFVTFRVLQDKTKRMRPPTQQGAPRAAFYFDDVNDGKKEGDTK